MNDAADDSAGADADPITLAVVEHRLESIAQEMTEAMLRTAMSQILNSSRDFSTAILDGDCQLVAQGEGIPVHISALPVAGAAVRDYFGDDIHDGDLFILNDPYFGGSHLPDITIIRPVFHQGRLLFYGVNRAHHSDVGGGTHGGYNPGANEIFQEGLRIPPLKLYDKGVPRYDLLQMMSANVRQSENFLGDLNAQIGSVMLAGRRIGDLLAEYGPDRLMAVVSEILSATERQVRRFISGWPDGVYHGESFVDDDGFDSKLVPIRAKVTIAGDSLTIDLSDSSPQVEGFINSAYANTRSLAHAAIMYLAPMDVARNEGSMRPVQIIAPRGLVVNANPPAPVCMSTNHCAEEVVEAVFKALAPAIPAAVSAGFSRRLRYAITGHDPRTGRQFIWHFFLARGGGGASEGFDGWSNVGEINVAGGIRSPSIEVTEERFPFFIERHELRPDSGGVGEWRGGLGAVCDLVYEGEGPALLNTAGDGIVVPPFGLFGATDGLPHHYKIVNNGTERVLGSQGGRRSSQPRRPHHLPILRRRRLRLGSGAGRRCGGVGFEERVCDSLTTCVPLFLCHQRNKIPAGRHARRGKWAGQRPSRYRLIFRPTTSDLPAGIWARDPYGQHAGVDGRLIAVLLGNLAHLRRAVGSTTVSGGGANAADHAEPEQYGGAPHRGQQQEDSPSIDYASSLIIHFGPPYDPVFLSSTICSLIYRRDDCQTVDM